MSQDFDLDLPSLWFTKLPPTFPVTSMKAKGPTTSTYAYSWEPDEYGAMQKVLIASVRWLDDLSTTKVHITWKATDPLHTARAQQKHFPPPAPLSPSQLDHAHCAYGLNTAAWAESCLGQTVGDGECWTLVQQALQDLAQTYAAHGQEPPLGSQGRSHGACILALSAGAPGDNAGLLQLADVRRGDILQMESAHFRTVEEAPPAARREWGTWQKGRAEKNVRLARHTAVVVGVEGEVVRVVEQNGAVPGVVSEGAYDLRAMVRGEVRVYRVVGEGWCGPLDASWE
ncbi:hypothetical protein MMC18_000250 [Xylographa bjoerkii]|nr:hypothetical protein [Xylographa bjoerkii]